MAESTDGTSDASTAGRRASRADPVEDAPTGAQRRNAVASGLLVVVLLGSAVGALLEGELLWAGFSVAVVAVAVVPVAIERDPTTLVDWELLLLAALPAATQAVDRFWQPLAYLSVAALALVVVAEIHAFSSARMPPWFAALFVTLTTMSVAAALGMTQFAADLLLGTGYLGSGSELMWDLVAATGVGIVAGLFFAVYCHEHGSIRTLAGVS